RAGAGPGGSAVAPLSIQARHRAIQGPGPAAGRDGRSSGEESHTGREPVSDKSAERVLVVPTALFHAIGVFQGFSPRVDDYLPRLLAADALSYRPRAEVETDPSFNQIIPYVVLRWREHLFPSPPAKTPP